MNRYLAKVSFFLDVSNREVYVYPIQRRPAKKGQDSKEWFRLTNRLQRDPCTFALIQVAGITKDEGYNRIKALRPKSHPLYIERHEGFLARYEPVIRAAGIREENGCYLERDLKKQKI